MLLRNKLLTPLLVLGSALVLGAVTLGIRQADAAGTWPSWSKTSTKIVPIVSVGTPGLRLGLAQVTGPASKMPLVRAVLQLDGDFKSVRAKIFVPSDSMTDLRRVQGTAVTGVVSYRLLDFSRKPTPPPAVAPSTSGGHHCPGKTSWKPTPHGNNGGHGKHKGHYKHGKPCRGH
jgi:hypothetical protein